jgi:hypothetical protein
LAWQAAEAVSSPGSPFQNLIAGGTEQEQYPEADKGGGINVRQTDHNP